MSSPAEAKQTESEEKQTSQVRLKWELMRFCRDRYKAETSVGLSLIVQRTSLGRGAYTWFGYVGGNRQANFETMEEAQLWCESQLTGLLLRDLGDVLGENWTDRPGKARLRVMTDIEVDDVTKEPDARGFHSFVIARNTQQIRRMHDDQCATNDGKPCDCPLNNGSYFEAGVGHA